MGISEAPGAALVPGIVQAESLPETRGLNTGIVMSSAPLVGTFVAPLVGVALAVAYGWRSAFYLICVPGIILALFMIKFLKEPASTFGKEKVKLDFKAVLGNKNVWLAAVAAIGFTGNNMLFQSFGPLLLISKGMTPQMMSYIFSATGISGFVWIIVAPWISDRIGRKATLIIMGCCAIILPLGFVFLNSTGALIAIALLGNTAIGMGALIAVLIPAESVGPKLMGTALGINLMAGDLIGGTFAPLMGGALSDKFGYPAAMYGCVGFLLLCALMGVFIKETAPRVLAKRAAKLAAK